MLCRFHDWATEKNSNLKPLQTVFLAENKGLETNFWAIFVSFLES